MSSFPDSIRRPAPGTDRRPHLTAQAEPLTRVAASIKAAGGEAVAAALRAAQPAIGMAARLGREALLDETERLSQSGAWDAFSELTREGTLFGDFARVHGAAGTRVDRPAAARRLAEDSCRSPLHRRRRLQALPELHRRAANHETSVKQELRNATVQALFLATNDIDPETPVDDLLSDLRTHVANRLSDDLIGPGWRHDSIRLDAAADPTTDETVESEAELAAFARALGAALEGLPARQRSAMIARLESRPLTNADHQALYRARNSPALRQLREAI